MSKKKLNPKRQVEIRTTNQVYQCRVCETWHDMEEDIAYCVHNVMGFQPKQTNIQLPPGTNPEFVPVIQVIMICPACVNKLDFSTQKIHTANLQVDKKSLHGIH